MTDPLESNSSSRNSPDAVRQVRRERSPDSSMRVSESASGNNIRIDLGSTTLAVVTVLVAIIGGCGVVMGRNLSEQSALEREFQRQTEAQMAAFQRETAEQVARMTELQRQYRMTELKLDDWTVVAHRSGLVLPGDYTRGPQGNLDSQSFKQPRK